MYMKKAKAPKDREAADASEASRVVDRDGPLRTDFRTLLGIGTKVPMNPSPKFTSEDQLWEKDVD